MVSTIRNNNKIMLLVSIIINMDNKQIPDIPVKGKMNLIHPIRIRVGSILTIKNDLNKKNEATRRMCILTGPSMTAKSRNSEVK